jgi:hypothetical protein
MVDDMDEGPERLRRFESEIAKFTPPYRSELPKLDPTLATIIGLLREHAKGINELCDLADAAVNASEDHARKAADSLMDMIKRVK